MFAQLDERMLAGKILLTSVAGVSFLSCARPRQIPILGRRARLKRNKGVILIASGASP